MLNVDVKYPRELHDSHSDYPLAPEKLTVDPTMYSPFMKEHYKQYTNSGTTTTKLSPNLYNKTIYIIQVDNLALYLRLGLKVTRINQVIYFYQESWLKPYINDNTLDALVQPLTLKNTFSN